MSVKIAVSGAAAEAVDRVVPQLVSDLVASGITAQDPTLWGPDAESESAIRLGWTEAVSIARPMVAGHRGAARQAPSRRCRTISSSAGWAAPRSLPR